MSREVVSSDGSKRYSASSAGFVNKDGLAVTQYNSGCFRSILVHQFVRANIPSIYSVIGDHDEARFSKVLDERGEENHQREVVIKTAGVLGVGYSSRADFVHYDENGVIKVTEKKSVTSSNTRLSAIRKGIPKINNLAQLISYMIQLRVSVGALRYDYYMKKPILKKDDPLVLIQTEEKEYNVLINEKGEILVDGEEYMFNVTDQFKHQLTAQKHIRDETVGDRPFGSEARFTSPCNYCKMSMSCDRFDMNAIDDQEFIDEAIKEIKLRDVLDDREVKIQTFKQRRKK